MPKMPRISGQQAVRAFGKAGWKAVRQKGSHVALIKEGSIFTLSIPLHKELGPGLLRDQIRKAGLSVEEFIERL
jgi:predicted RNA binding protein YcfA (HicA-like mRNA interferase family)